METKAKTVIRDRNYKVNCECGGFYLMQNKNKHLKAININIFLNLMKKMNIKFIVHVVECILLLI